MDFEKVTVENNKVAWKCNRCGETVVQRRNHTCENPMDNPDTPLGRFVANYSQVNQGTSPMTRNTPPGPPQTPNTSSFDMAQLMEILKHQQDQSQRSLQIQMEQQIQREERMFDRMMRSQQMFIEKQQETQTEFTKNVEERMRNDEGKEKDHCYSHFKRPKCPKWDVHESLESFCERLEIWDKLDPKGKGKYLDFIDALQQSERRKEKERCILEVRNRVLDPEDPEIISKIITNLHKWFGKTKTDKFFGSWKEFIDFKREAGEAIDESILRYDTIDSKLRASGEKLSQRALACHLVFKLDVDEMEKQNILSSVKFEDNENVYEDVKQKIRLLKGSLVTSTDATQKSSTKEPETNETNDAVEEVAHYGENSKRYYQSNNRNYRNNDRYNKYQGRNQYDNSRKSRSRSSSKSRSRSKERKSNRDQKNSEDERNDRNQRGKRDGRNEHIINWNFNENVETVEETILAVASEVDRMIVDTAATKSVAGEFWYKNHREIVDNKTKSMMKTRDEKRNFRFGNSVRYPSLFEVDIPFQLGNLDTDIHVSIIKADIPLLLGLEDMKKLGFVIDCDNKTIFTKRTDETFQLEVTDTNHLALPFVPMIVKNEDDILLTETDTTKEKMKKIKKIHHIMGHPHEDTLKIFYKDSSENDALTMNMIEEVTNNCKVCKYKFRKTPPRPKVGLPVSRNFNQCVSIDLKGPFNKKYILYCVDTFSRLTRGIIIKDKNPNTIVKGLIDCWILGKGIGPGMPVKFIFDNGREFTNPKVIDLAEKFGLPLSNVTAAYSPYSNGICERNHAVVDKMMAKMMASDPTLDEQSALDYALH